MIDEIDELMEEIQQAPGDNSKRIENLRNMKEEIKMNIEEAETAMEKLEQVADFTNSLESEESNFESALG
jgi:DNA repair exonuclease SbcCD ATPase subunit